MTALTNPIPKYSKSKNYKTTPPTSKAEKRGRGDKERVLRGNEDRSKNGKGVVKGKIKNYNKGKCGKGIVICSMKKYKKPHAVKKAKRSVKPITKNY